MRRQYSLAYYPDNTNWDGASAKYTLRLETTVTA